VGGDHVLILLYRRKHRRAPRVAGPASLALVIVFLWFGGMKFAGYEANGIAPFIANSPIMSWLHVLFGVQGASYVIGVLELATAIALIAGAFNPIAIGAAA
jgi:reactive chlorine resistance protein C